MPESLTTKTSNLQNAAFLDAIVSSPKMTKEVNRARRKMSEEIKDLISKFETATNWTEALND